MGDDIKLQQLWSTPFMTMNVMGTHEELIYNLINMVLMDDDAKSRNATALTRDTMQLKRDEGDPLVLEAIQLMEQVTDIFFEKAFGISSIPHRIEPFYLMQPQYQNVTYHNHGSMVTGILYLDVPGGDVIFYDPRTNANRGMGVVSKSGHFAPMMLSPKAGDVIIFPSYVFHVGTPNLAPRSRLLMPFDVMA